MVHHGYARPIFFKPMYTKGEWLKIKEANKYNDVMFMFLDGKEKLNPSKDLLPKNFVEIPKYWIAKRNPTDLKAFELNNYYKCFEICDMSDLMEVFESNSIVEFFQHEQIERVVGIVAITNNTKPFALWNNDKWDRLLSLFLNNSMNIIAIVYVCDKESFGYLMATMHKLRFVTRLMFEFGIYHLQENELPLKWSIVIGTLILSYVYLFLKMVSTDGVKKALENKCPPNIFKIVFTIQKEECKVYQVEVSPKA
jgi:hypothetical protein